MIFRLNRFLYEGFDCILDLLDKKFSFTSCYFSSACRLHADDAYESQWKMTH